MNTFRRGFAACLLAVCFTFLFAVSASAKSYTPSKVTSLTAKASESVVKLTWKAASGATSYQVYMKTGSSGTYKRVTTTKNTTYTKSGLKNGQTYYFRIRSVRTVGSKKYYSTSYSKVVSAKPVVKSTSPPTNFKAYQACNSKVYLSWSAASNATGYAIYKYDTSTKKYKLIGTTKSTSYTVSGLTNGKSYKFKARTYRKVGTVTRYSTKYTSVVTVTPQKLSSSVSSVHTAYFSATVKSTVTATPANSSSKKQTVKKGAKVTVISYGTICKVKLTNGQQVYIRYSNLNFKSILYTTKSYSKTLKQDFVNQRGYTSKTKYLIWVSTYTQEYSLFTGSRGKWTLIRTAKVSTGRTSNPTAARVCSITKKATGWYYEDGTYQAPVVYFYSLNAFHSRLHNSDGSIADATIGKPASSGCVRMYDADIQYIYKYCPIGTTVVIY